MIDRSDERKLEPPLEEALKEAAEYAQIRKQYVDIENRLRDIAAGLLETNTPELVICAWGNVGNEMLLNAERKRRDEKES